MSVNIIDRYVKKKAKDLCEYANIIENMIKIENNGMWYNKREFSSIAKGITEYYAVHYYFDNNEHPNDPIKYFNDNISSVLTSITEYCKDEDKAGLLMDLKSENFLMFVIICTACYVDFASNVVDGDIGMAFQNFDTLIAYLEENPSLQINKDKKLKRELYDCVKKNCKEDLEVVHILDSELYKNKYKMLSIDPLCFKVLFKYNIPGLNEFDEDLVKDVLKEYNDEFNEVSLEILAFHILEQLISNKEMPRYFVNINKEMKRASVIRYFNNPYIKEHVSVLVPYDEEINYQEVLEKYKENEVSIVYQYDNTENINSSILENDMELLVDKEFILNNKDNENNFKRMGVSFIIRNKEEL